MEITRLYQNYYLKSKNITTTKDSHTSFEDEIKSSKTNITDNKNHLQNTSPDTVIINVGLGREGRLYSTGGVNFSNTINVFSDKSSTEDDPSVIVMGTDSDGKDYEVTVKINDINVQNANQVEAAALIGYLKSTGELDKNYSPSINMEERYAYVKSSEGEKNTYEWSSVFNKYNPINSLKLEASFASYHNQLERYLNLNEGIKTLINWK